MSGVRNENGQYLDPIHSSAEFTGYVADIVIDPLDWVTAEFALDRTDPLHVVGTTTITWHRENPIVGETYQIYRYPANATKNFKIIDADTMVMGPIADWVDPTVLPLDSNAYKITDSVQLTLASSRLITPISNPHPYTVPANTDGWFWYALVVNYNSFRKILVPKYGVWESVVGPNYAEPPVLSLGTGITPNPGHQKVNLEWTEVVASNVGYKLYYYAESMTDCTHLTQWKEAPYYADYLTALTTTVTDLTNDISYYFRVQAINTLTGEAGPFSNQIEAVPREDAVVPDPATVITATDMGVSGKVEVCWVYTEPINFGHYDIYYSMGDFSVLTQATKYGSVDAGELCAVVDGLENDIRYCFAVVPVSAAGKYYGQSGESVTTACTTPRSWHQKGEDQITVFVNNQFTAVSGIAEPHVIYGMLRVPVEYSDSISLKDINISISVTLSAIGGTVETLTTVSDADGFWSVNLGNLTLSEWKERDYVAISVRDWATSFVGEASLYVTGEEGAQRTDILMSDSSLRSPILYSPITGGTSEYPIFKLYSEVDTANLKFKIEVSDDNFRTILRVFDENSANTGWTRTIISVGGVDTLMAVYRSFQQDRLVNGEDYQWRAYAWNGIRYSSPSGVAQFKVVSEQLDKSSSTWYYVIDADPIVELYGLTTDSYDFGPTDANGAIITDSLPIFKWRLLEPTVKNVHFRMELDTDETFGNAGGKLRIYDSKDDPTGFEYSNDGGRTWYPFERTGVEPGIQLFRFVTKSNLEVN